MPRPLNVMKDPGLLEAALEGLLLQKERIETQIREIREVVGARRVQREPAGARSGGTATKKRRRTLSDAARKRIAAAQKKRWAEYRRQTSEPKATRQTRARKEAKPAKEA